MAASSESHKLGLDLQQSQRLLPLQVRIGRMLEMNAAEVEDEVRRALEELPALEADHSSAEQPSGTDPIPDHESFNETADQMQLADYRGDEEVPPSFYGRGAMRDDSSAAFEPVAVSDETSLIDVLTRQLNELNVSPGDRVIARYIIGNIDGNGYMERSTSAIADDIAIQTGLDATPDDVRRVRDVIRSLDPAGIAAVDLRDCLLLQLKRRKETQAVKDATEIVRDYFDLFSKMHLDRIASMMNISRERLRDAIDIIRQLNPKPGSEFGGAPMEETASHIIPDFIVETDGDTIHLQLANNIPELSIDAAFAEDTPAAAAPDGGIRSRDAFRFIKRHRDEARDFIKILKSRQETLFAVMSAIVKHQREFFLTDDPGRIRPMILKDISAVTGLDLSVISRATTSKYVATQRGVYPIKMFFNEPTAGDADASSHGVMAALKKIIADEDKDRPLSDEAIAAIMNAKGFELARRTVAKYRERLGIPVARLRKKI